VRRRVCLIPRSLLNSRVRVIHFPSYFIQIPIYINIAGKVGGGAKKEEKKVAKEEKKEKKKEEKPKKEEKKKEEEVPEELDAAEEALLAEPKSKDPFDELPKGTFNFEDFKRFYSNNDEAKSIPYFWEKFDKENYSIWYGEYKYPEELTKVFMSCNLITGKIRLPVSVCSLFWTTTSITYMRYLPPN
jgi:Elongation factor 1 gamma, conserved domain